MPNSPRLYVIAGPNGAGKTTFAREFLPQITASIEFVNADMIASGLSPFHAEAAAIQAGRLMLQRIRILAASRKDFGFETTLSGRAYMKWFRDLKQLGYEIHLFFLWLPSVQLAEKRIADRVRLGGHDVPRDVVRRRFRKNVRNLFQHYRSLCDSISLVDNSGDEPRLLWQEYRGEQRIVDAVLFARIEREAIG